MHYRKWSIAGDYVLIQNYMAIRFGAPGTKRKKKTKETGEAQQQNNIRRKADKLQLLILENFREGQHVILRYSREDRDCTYKEAEERLSKFLRRIRRELKGTGREFKYIAITERGKKREVLHHHMIVEDDPLITELIKKHWGRNIVQSPMYEDGCYRKLAEYIVKAETKEESAKGRAKYHRSRNLTEPRVSRMLTDAKWSDDPVIPPGFELVPDSFYNGETKVLGLKFQRYMLHRIEHRNERPKPPKRQQSKLKKIVGAVKKKLGSLRRRHGP